MRQSIWSVNTPANPQAFITKRKARVKQFEGQVYLNDGDEYEIELFNPTPTFILAKIKVDNEYLSNGGIVLRPGERVFLERHLESANKFVFKTYEVGKEAVSLGAIDNNGYVEIQFFNEWKPNRPLYTSFGSGGTTGGYNPFTLTSTSGTYTLASGTCTTSGVNTFYNSNLTSGTSNIKTFVNKAEPLNASAVLRSSKVETGRTEKGDTSNQTFTQSNREFTTYSFHNVAWRILPATFKQYHKEELNVAYCAECGAKRKKDTHKFCPHCGTKF
jgi:hypothetical protein